MQIILSGMPLYRDKADENAFIISSVFSVVKSVDPADKKYAVILRSVRPTFQFRAFVLQ